MAPIQVLTNNLLYDISQSAIPTRLVDEEYHATPRPWDVDSIFKFMLVVGPISSIFDYATFAMMIFVFSAWSNPSVFRTGWFLESLLTQTSSSTSSEQSAFPCSKSEPALLYGDDAHHLGGRNCTSIELARIGAGFTPLPALYWPMIAAIMLAYSVMTHLVKAWLVRRWAL